MDLKSFLIVALCVTKHMTSAQTNTATESNHGTDGFDPGFAVTEPNKYPDYYPQTDDSATNAAASLDDYGADDGSENVPVKREDSATNAAATVDDAGTDDGSANKPDGKDDSGSDGSATNTAANVNDAGTDDGSANKPDKTDDSATNTAAAVDDSGTENGSANEPDKKDDSSVANDATNTSDKTKDSVNDNNAEQNKDVVSVLSDENIVSIAHDDDKTNEAEHDCKKVGRFAHPSSCTKYYYCWENHGEAYEFTCPDHRAFDPVTQICTSNYGVCALAPKCEKDNQVITNPDDKFTFFQCLKKQDESGDSNEYELQCKPCADDREYDEKLGYCKSTSLNGEMIVSSEEHSDNMYCPETGLFIDYDDDTRYYQCVVRSITKGILKPVLHKCPSHHVFSMEERQCVAIASLAGTQP